MVRWVGLLSIITVFASVLAYMFLKGVHPLAGIFVGIYGCCVLYGLDSSLKKYDAKPEVDGFKAFEYFIMWSSASGVITFCVYYFLNKIGW